MVSGYEQLLVSNKLPSIEPPILPQIWVLVTRNLVLIPGACLSRDAPYAIIVWESGLAVVRATDVLTDLLFVASLHEVLENTEAGEATGFSTAQIHGYFISMTAVAVAKTTIAIAKFVVIRRMQHPGIRVPVALVMLTVQVGNFAILIRYSWRAEASTACDMAILWLSGLSSGLGALVNILSRQWVFAQVRSQIEVSTLPSQLLLEVVCQPSLKRATC